MGFRGTQESRVWAWAFYSSQYVNKITVQVFGCSFSCLLLENQALTGAMT